MLELATATVVEADSAGGARSADEGEEIEVARVTCALAGLVTAGTRASWPGVAVECDEDDEDNEDDGAMASKEPEDEETIPAEEEDGAVEIDEPFAEESEAETVDIDVGDGVTLSLRWLVDDEVELPGSDVEDVD